MRSSHVVNYVVMESVIVRVSITSDYDYCSLCAVCALTYELCESELSLGRLSNMLC